MFRRVAVEPARFGFVSCNSRVCFLSAPSGGNGFEASALKSSSMSRRFLRPAPSLRRVHRAAVHHLSLSVGPLLFGMLVDL